jgi:hypothetical protein
MPNAVSYSDDRTLMKACEALMGDEVMSFIEAKAAIDRLMGAGLLIREPAVKETKEGSGYGPTDSS